VQRNLVKTMSGDPDFMLSLARGLAVLRAFEGNAGLTVAQAASITGLSRSSVRRCLLTLEQLGHVRATDGRYRLEPGLLPLAHAYVVSDPLALAAQPVVDVVRDSLGEACSLAVLDLGRRGAEVIYVARAEAPQPIAMPLRIGSTVPAYCSALGRVLLAGMERAALDIYLGGAPFARRTPATLTGADEIRAACHTVRAEGYAEVREELEPGLRSLAVPVRDGEGRTVAALNVGAAAARWPDETRTGHILAELRAAATHLARVIHAPGA